MDLWLYQEIQINKYAPSITHLMFADDMFLFENFTLQMLVNACAD